MFGFSYVYFTIESYRLAALMAPPLRPPDGLGDMPDALDPLGWRARVSTGDGIVDLLRGNVLDEPGWWREAESGRWKLGVRRIPVGVFCAYPPSAQANIS